MNIFIIFIYKILAKYSPNASNCTIFKNFLRGPYPRTPLTHAWLPPIFQKYFEPPPRNKIQDTPLLTYDHVIVRTATRSI